jgi:hypothetical protein
MTGPTRNLCSALAARVVHRPIGGSNDRASLQPCSVLFFSIPADGTELPRLMSVMPNGKDFLLLYGMMGGRPTGEMAACAEPNGLRSADVFRPFRRTIQKGLTIRRTGENLLPQSTSVSLSSKTHESRGSNGGRKRSADRLRPICASCAVFVLFAYPCRSTRRRGFLRLFRGGRLATLATHSRPGPTGC